MNTIDQKLQQLQKYAPLILRFGLAFVFIWFGVNQLQNPSQWTALLPSWTISLPFSQIQFVLLNGWFEIVGAGLFIFGAYTRIVAVLLALHLFGISWTVGWNAVGVRDIGLACATLALGLLGAGEPSADAIVNQENI
jgi:uncharacterized membrane protein YphA (DoxX/SURF4 family)